MVSKRRAHMRGRGRQSTITKPGARRYRDGELCRRGGDYVVTVTLQSVRSAMEP